MGNEYRIRVSGRPRSEFDIDLLVQAILAITEQRLDAERHDEEPDNEASA